MLVVTDFGQRIQTPWRDAFAKKGVRPIVASSRSATVSNKDRMKESDYLEKHWPFEHYSAQQPLSDYQRIAAPASERQAVLWAEQIM